MNACGWIAPIVTLVDGTVTDSESEEWRAECEARYMLKRTPIAQKDQLERIQQRRGQAAHDALVALMLAVEPAYVLGLPNKAQRHSYLRNVEQARGENAATHLRNQAEALHAERKACAAASA